MLPTSNFLCTQFCHLYCMPSFKMTWHNLVLIELPSSGSIHDSSIHLEAILACHPALSTKWVDWVAKCCERWLVQTGLITWGHHMRSSHEVITSVVIHWTCVQCLPILLQDSHCLVHQLVLSRHQSLGCITTGTAFWQHHSQPLARHWTSKHSQSCSRVAVSLLSCKTAPISSL